MKNDKFLKVGLSVLCTAVLAACGGSDDNSPKPTNTPTTTAIPTATTSPTATTTATPTPSSFALTPGGARLTDAEQADRTAQLNDEGKGYTAIQQIKKTNSDVNGTNDSNSGTQRVSDTTLVPALDTVVVTVPTTASDKVTYVEDFQFNVKGNKKYSTNTASAAGSTDLEVFNLLPATITYGNSPEFIEAYNAALKEVSDATAAAANGATPAAQLTDYRNHIGANLTAYSTTAANRNTPAKAAVADAIGRLAGKVASSTAYTGPYAAHSPEAALQVLKELSDVAPEYAKETAATRTVNTSDYRTDDEKVGLVRTLARRGSGTDVVQTTIGSDTKLFKNARENGTARLENIYAKRSSSSDTTRDTKADGSNSQRRLNNIEVGRDEYNNVTNITETETKGRQTTAAYSAADTLKDAYTYQTGRRIYADLTDDSKYTKKSNSATYVNTTDGKSIDGDGGNINRTIAGSNALRTNQTFNSSGQHAAGNVAEVYGNKTFAYEIGITDSDYTDNFVNDGGNNAPFTGTLNQATGVFENIKPLQHVQYGRVTSAISGLQPSNLKTGVTPDTVVGQYGEFGANGTESTYFSRGNNHITQSQVAALDGKLTYAGHAVGYGLDDSYNTKVAASNIPNAVGRGSAGYKLWSGNHVEATIDTAKKNVTGSIYNIWSNGAVDRTTNKMGLDKVDLVTFKGDFGANGNMIGTSTLVGTNNTALTAEDKAGTFHASLFGAQGEELGGNVKSNTQEADKAWGASFGAARVNASPWADQISQ